MGAQGFETFDSCFRTLAGHNLLPYSVEDTGEVVGALSFCPEHASGLLLHPPKEERLAPHA